MAAFSLCDELLVHAPLLHVMSQTNGEVDLVHENKEYRQVLLFTGPLYHCCQLPSMPLAAMVHIKLYRKCTCDGRII